MKRLELLCHPETPSRAVNRIEVTVDRVGERDLKLTYQAFGDPGGVLVPEPAERPGRTDELWRHTCFEIFVRTSEGYREFNLSPSGQWASFAFDGYREGKTDAAEVATVEPLDGACDQVELEARIELPPHASAFGLSAVIEDVDGGISYWALAHPSDKPDFHHPDSFTLELPAPEPA